MKIKEFENLWVEFWNSEDFFNSIHDTVCVSGVE